MAEQKDIAQELLNKLKGLPDEKRQLVINIITQTIVKYAIEGAPERKLSFDLKIRDGKVISFRSVEK